ncbi:SpoIIE family protein phosphatase [bacterium]|nr:SpoIIE family protein phosphatase [candidate division CSSED10-310 bacterium]
MPGDPLHQDDFKDKLIFVLSALDDMGDILTRSMKFEYTAKYLMRLILGSIGITKGAIYIYITSKEFLKPMSATTRFPHPKSTMHLGPEDAARLAGIGEPIRIHDPEIRVPGIPPEPIRIWRENGIQVLAPLAVKGELIGLVCLGPLLGGRKFGQSDLEMLRLLARHISVSFLTNKLLNETQKVNFKLNRKILELEQLHEVGLAIVRLRSSGEMLDEILTRASAILDARYGAFWRNDGGRRQLSGVFGFERDSIPDLLSGISDDPVSPTDQSGRFALYVPVTVRDTCYGYLAVAGKESRGGDFMEFTDTDRQLLTSFANQAGVALENAYLYEEALEKERMEKDLQIALEIQKALLPQTIPEVPGLEIAALTLPCRTIGGDFYDIEAIPGGGTAVTIADVSGKGVPAAMLVSTFHAVFHMLRPHLADLEESIGRFNKLICEATPDNKFISAVFAIWYPEKESMRLLTAGHDPTILMRSDGSHRVLNAGGLILGLFPDATYSSQTVLLRPGDLMCMYTDGIIDLRNSRHEHFGLDRLVNLCRDNRSQSSDSILETISRACRTFRDDIPAPDDQTLIIIRRTGSIDDGTGRNL